MSKQKQRGFAFPTSKKLFWRRLFSHWREQSAIIRTAADWTVLLYILIPGDFWEDGYITGSGTRHCQLGVEICRLCSFLHY